MAWYEILIPRHKLTIIQHLNAHLAGMTFEQKVEALKAIVKEVCPGVHCSLNPPTGRKKSPKKLGAEAGKEK